jgi:hypothetical protein
VLLSAGAIVSSLLWFIIEKLEDVFFSELWDRATNGLPIEFVSISVALIWALGYYGPGMLWDGPKAMASPTRRKFWRMLNAAKKRSEEQAKDPATGA